MRALAACAGRPKDAANQKEGEGLEQGRIDAYRLYLLMARWRRFILRTVLLVCVACVIVLLLLPNWYKATTSVLPAERESSFMGLASSLLQGVGALGGQEMVLPAFATPSHVYASILKSRTVVEAVVRKHGLKERYGSKTMDDAVKECLTHTRIKVGPEGFVILSFEDTNRQRAADVANSFVETLNQINTEVSSSRARGNRVFLEDRLGATSEALGAAEDTLRRFQEINRAISIDDQMKAQIQNVAGLEGGLAMAEIELGLLERTMTPGHPEIVRKQMEISETRRRIKAMNVGGPGADDYGTLSVPFARVPGLALEYGRLLREVKIQETLFGLLTEQYERAKIQEVKDTPTIQVLDVAKPPEKKSRPKRLIILAITGGLGFVLSVLYASLSEHLARLKETRPEDWESLRDTTADVRADLSGAVGGVRRLFRRRQ
jgi:uncharacterized protein involved in exopolysaccharide biosynthesis